LTVAYDGACSPNFFWMAWTSFGTLPCRKNRTWQVSSRHYWGRPRRLTCFLSASWTRKVIQFDTWTDPSSQRHSRFPPTTSGIRSG
jgi:hypothetical protein